MYKVLLVCFIISFTGCPLDKLLPTPAPVIEIDEHDAKAKAVVSILVTEFTQDSKPSPQPDVTPTGKCPTCKGTGKVGDGRVFSTCMDCNGTGKVTVSEQAPTYTTEEFSNEDLSKEELIEAPMIEPEPSPAKIPEQGQAPAPAVKAEVEAPAFQPATPAKQEIIKKKLFVYTAPWCGPCQLWKLTRAPQFEALGIEVVYIDWDQAVVQNRGLPIVFGKKQIQSVPFFTFENMWFSGDLTPEFVVAQGLKLQ